MGLLLLLGPKLLPEFRDPNAGRLDIASTALSIAAVLATIYGLKLVAQNGIGWTPVLSIVVGLALGEIFVRRQRHLTDPLINLQLFRSQFFSATLIIFILNAFVMFAVSFFTAQYFQHVLGLSPLHAGLWTLPAAFSVIVGSMLPSMLVHRIPRSVVMIVGLLICAVGFGLLMLVGAGGQAVLVIGSVVIGLGAGPISTVVPDVIVGSAPPDQAGSAASLSSTSAEFGGALEVAILGSVGLAIYRFAIVATIPSGLSSEAALATRETLGGAFAVARNLPPAVGAPLMEAAHRAFAQAFVANALVCAVIMLVAAAIMSVAMRRADFPALSG